MYKFKNVGLWGRLAEGNVSSTAQRVIAHLRARQVQVFAPPSATPIARQVGGLEIVEEAELAARADVIVAVGGDGTM
ncbi:MAG TPA: hypothetical protein VFY39_07970, partial [Gammaproteobacteria bacterium]|nr:hypothetical protein [Gammaproteobacteria bacterium]